MIVFGVGANNQVTNSKDANGTWLSINMCWGIGVLIGVYCSEGGSGANLKHARALRVRPPAAVKGPGYMLSQLLGAFVGAFVIYVQYQNLNSIDPNLEDDAEQLLDVPERQHLRLHGLLHRRHRHGHGIARHLCHYGPAQPPGRPRGRCSVRLLPHDHDLGKDDTGTAVNPARDLGSRVFTTVAGWGSKVFSTRSCIPLVADSLGVVSSAGTL
ncbi:hypothetical protein PR002_g18511 [Phytophthora rubi]|uniref:Aquaporin n=1 Tax=Phytophthora rubi TaxID=129364 RepID=A0A6A3JZB7_9STRA|nr:hypothetical protein PR002_g18511 [Phytophthora rubi]